MSISEIHHSSKIVTDIKKISIESFVGARPVSRFWRDLDIFGGLRPPGSHFLAGPEKIWRESRHPAGVEWSLCK